MFGTERPLIKKNIELEDVKEKLCEKVNVCIE
jgi:hypothetical protein